MQLKKEDIIKYCETFIGYGSLSADIAIIGMEEGDKYKPNEVLLDFSESGLYLLNDDGGKGRKEARMSREKKYRELFY